ncbi:P-loop containing nucleoside triphosphate hydrolase protein [Xylariales sp. PMI_506]|nr:P-loop containing nucleoside triphosphate hydrolase protein [Xylariales sp. PMI_506]
MGAQPSIPRDPSRKLEVIDAGFSRTGTLSFTLAIEKLLDGPVMHGGTQLVLREDAYCKKISQLYAYRRQGDRARLLKTLEEVIRGFVGCADVPMVHFLPELMELYPDAKVVLVTRDPDSWWKSFSVFGDENVKQPWVLYALQLLVLPLPGIRWYPSIARGFEEDFLHTHDVKIPNRDFLEKHHEWVRKQVPQDKLLEMSLAGGWEPLCKFLGKPVPQEPFPRANDAANRDKVMRDVLVKAAVAWTGILTATSITAFGAWYLWKHR